MTLVRSRNRGLAALAILALGGASLSNCVASATPEPSLLITVQAAPGEVLAFEPTLFQAPPHTRVRIAFVNTSALEHNLVFVAPLAARTREIVVPGASDAVDFETPAAGSYRFVCTIHQGMEGSLRVQ